jgi:hypothetical protein
LQNSDAIDTVTITDTDSGGPASAAAGGTYHLTPSVAHFSTGTSGNYLIGYNTGLLSVGQATLTITANAQNKVYGTTQTTPVTGSTAFTPTGLQNGETVGSVTLTYGAGGLLATSPAGSTSTITPSAAMGGTFNTANYNISFMAGTLTVTQASSATALATSVTPALPGSNVVFTATISGVTTPTGAVQFKANGAAFGAAITLDGSGIASITNSTLPHGSNTITAEYSGDVNFLVSTGSVSQVIDRPPVGGLQYLTTTVNTPLSVSAATLASLNYDPDGDTLTITAVSGSSTNGGTVTLSGTVNYTPAAGYVGADLLTYTVSDGYGGTATCTNKVTVTLGKATSAFNYISGTSGTVNLRGYGIPTHQYDVQRSATVAFSAYTTLATVTAASGSGVILYTDATAGAGPWFYRFAVH